MSVSDKIIKRTVGLSGLRPIMFDPYPGDNKTTLPPEQKFYLDTDRHLCIPALNIMSFLCAQNTPSACKMFYDPRKYKRVAQILLGSVGIDPMMVKLTRHDKPIAFEGFGKNGITLHRAVARLDKGIPNPKERPLVDTPWEMDFTVSIIPNDAINEAGLRLLFERGGMAIGFGTFRGPFGKFEVTRWE